MKTAEELYRTMLTARLVEERLQRLCDRGEAGDLHFSRGQEAISTGVCAVLNDTDHIVTHHRTIAHEIARGANLHPLIAEVLGKATGLNGGRAGEMQLSNPATRHAFSFQIVGTCIPVAAGLAWALRKRWRRDEIVVVFIGDATTSNGQFHEGLNLAAIHDVPLLIVVENNRRAGNITRDHYIPPLISMSDRARAHGIAHNTVDGNDLNAVIDAARRAVAHVRTVGPYLLDCHTERLCWHKQGQRDVRSAQELAQLELNEPLRRYLERNKKIDAEAIRKEIEAQLDAVFEQVKDDPIPEVYND